MTPMRTEHLTPAQATIVQQLLDTGNLPADVQKSLESWRGSRRPEGTPEGRQPVQGFPTGMPGEPRTPPASAPDPVTPGKRVADPVPEGTPKGRPVVQGFPTGLPGEPKTPPLSAPNKRVADARPTEAERRAEEERQRRAR